MFRVVKETGQDTGVTDSHASDRCHWRGNDRSFCQLETQKALRLAAEGLLCVVFVRRERKSHKEVWFLWMMLYYPAKLSES